MNSTESEPQTVGETIKATMTSEDKPLGEKVPGAPFAVVALTYLAILAVSGLVLATILWLI